MENKADQIFCNQLLHVICLPFNIKTDKDEPVCLNDVTHSLAGSPWKEGAAPDAFGSPPWDEFHRYQSRAYFHPFVRRFLFDRKRVARFHRDDVQRLKIELDSQPTGKFEVLADIHRCEMVLFQPDIGVLLLEISPQAPLSLQQTQLLLDAFRRLYPPYVGVYCIDNQPTWFGGHCPVEVTLLDDHGNQMGDPGKYRGNTHDFMAPYSGVLLDDQDVKRPRYPWAGHWHTLLEPFDCTGKAQGKLQARQLGDDRAPILSWIALDDPREVDRGDWMRTCFSDSPGCDPLPYAGKFMQEFENKYCYDRYWYADAESAHSPSRILNCGYAFAFVGCSKDPYFFTDKNNGAHAIFRHIYVEMGLIAHFQKAALLAASQRLSELVKREGKEGKDIVLPDQQEVREFYDRFVEFTQDFWFDEITPQEQGREMFQMWSEHLRIQEIYNEVRQELKDLVDYTELRAAGELNNKLTFVAVVGAFIASFSLLAGIFGMNQDMKWLLPDGPLSFLAGSPQVWLAQLGIGLACLCLVGVPAYFAYRPLNKRIKTYPDREIS